MQSSSVRLCNHGLSKTSTSHATARPTGRLLQPGPRKNPAAHPPELNKPARAPTHLHNSSDNQSHQHRYPQCAHLHDCSVVCHKRRQSHAQPRGSSRPTEYPGPVAQYSNDQERDVGWDLEGNGKSKGEEGGEARRHASG